MADWLFCRQRRSRCTSQWRHRAARILKNACASWWLKPWSHQVGGSRVAASCLFSNPLTRICCLVQTRGKRPSRARYMCDQFPSWRTASTRCPFATTPCHSHVAELQTRAKSFMTLAQAQRGIRRALRKGACLSSSLTKSTACWSGQPTCGCVKDNQSSSEVAISCCTATPQLCRWLASLLERTANLRAREEEQGKIGRGNRLTRRCLMKARG